MAGKLSQPGCHINTGTGKSRRSLVKLDGGDLLENHNQKGKRTIPPMRGQLGKEKKKKQGKKILGRKASFLQFSAKPSKVTFKDANEGVQAALRKFRTYNASSPQKAVQVLATIKEKFPHLLVNRRHSGEGHVPGVQVGDTFGFRAELCLVGLHKPPQAGIDWKLVESNDGNEVSIAVSIVISGGYEDDLDKGETLIYTGEGGQNLKGGKRQCEDQKFTGGNMALRNSCAWKNSVRVIRGREDSQSPSGILYSYDGLYKVVEWAEDLGISNFKIFKFTLVREDGQKPLIWQFPGSSPRKKISRGFESPPRMRFGGQVSPRY